MRIAFDPNPTNTSIYVAQEQGFFKKNGLNVKLSPIPGAGAQLPAIGKQFDLITTTATDAIRGAANGLKPVVVQAETIERKSAPSTALMVDPSIRSLSDLKGKTVGVVALSGVLYTSLIVDLHAQGISQNDVKFVQVPFPNMLDELKSKRIQAALDIVPFNFPILQAGFKELPNPMLAATSGQPTLTAGWAADKSWAQSNMDTINKFRKANEEAVAWMKSNDKAARQVLVKDFHLPAVAAAKYPLTQFVSLPIQASYFQPWIAPMEAVGMIKKGAVSSGDQLVLSGS